MTNVSKSGFVIFCDTCNENSKINIQHNPTGELIFDCFNCGKSWQFTPNWGRRTTKERWEKNKELIETEKEIRNIKNNIKSD